MPRTARTAAPAAELFHLRPAARIDAVEIPSIQLQQLAGLFNAIEELAAGTPAVLAVAAAGRALAEDWANDYDVEREEIEATHRCAA
jgi:hypothetical protein